MSDLPLDETALKAAEEALDDYARENNYAKLRTYEQAPLAISTYLQKAKFDLQLNPMRDEQRQVGPWEPIPVVQAESEEE